MRRCQQVRGSMATFGTVARPSLSATRDGRLCTLCAWITRALIVVPPKRVRRVSRVLSEHGPYHRGNWRAHFAPKRLTASDRPVKLPSINSPDGGPCQCFQCTIPTPPLPYYREALPWWAPWQAKLPIAGRCTQPFTLPLSARTGSLGKALSCIFHIKYPPSCPPSFFPHHTLT